MLLLFLNPFILFVFLFSRGTNSFDVQKYISALQLYELNLDISTCICMIFFFCLLFYFFLFILLLPSISGSIILSIDRQIVEQTESNEDKKKCIEIRKKKNKNSITIFSFLFSFFIFCLFHFARLFRLVALSN